MSEEICVDCEEPTGRAGRSDDSLYFFDDGPFCEGCWPDALYNIAHRQHEQIAALQKKVSGFIAGECSCPHSTGSASHFPGCPKICADKVADFEIKTADLRETLKNAIYIIKSYGGIYKEGERVLSTHKGK